MYQKAIDSKVESLFCLRLCRLVASLSVKDSEFSIRMVPAGQSNRHDCRVEIERCLHQVPYGMSCSGHSRDGGTESLLWRSCRSCGHLWCAVSRSTGTVHQCGKATATAFGSCHTLNSPAHKVACLCKSRGSGRYNAGRCRIYGELTFVLSRPGGPITDKGRASRVPAGFAYRRQ